MPSFTARQREAILRRAIIGVKPEYYSWPVEAQERYRVSIPGEEAFRFDQILLKELFGIRVDTQEAADAVFKGFDDERSVLFTSTALPFAGIGDDSFVLNEYLGDKTILDFETLHDYDHDYYCFQEAVRQDEMPGYIPKPYRGDLHHRWARLQIDGAFHYATLSMAAVSVFSMIARVGSEKIDQLIPHEYVKGKNHGRRAGAGTVFDYRPDAGGLEPQLEELQSRFHLYQSGRYEALLDHFDAEAAGAVYLVDKSSTHDPHMDFIFSDKTALRKVRFRHFMADCREIAGDARALDPVMEQERRSAIAFLDEAHRDILNTFDPKIVKLSKRREIIVADGAFDGLDGGSEE